MRWVLGTAFLVCAVFAAASKVQIADEIEQDLPMEARPSWKMGRVRRFPSAELRSHRELYPASWLRMVFCAAAVRMAVSFVAALVAGR
jgi:hypothetical protein